MKNNQNDENNLGQISKDSKKFPGIKIVFLLVIVSLIMIGYFQFKDSLTLSNIAEQESELRDFEKTNPILVYGVAFAIYVAVTGLSLPGAAPLTLVFGWFFGFWHALILVSFASTTGATLAFLMSRYILRDSIQAKFGDRLAAINLALERDGAFYLFTMRLIPAIPFFVINLVMGLTPIRVTTYWWVSQLGMLPGTAVYVYAGSTVPDLNTLSEKGTGGILSPQLIIAFVLLGIFPFVIKFVMKLLRPGDSTNTENADNPVEMTDENYEK